MKDELQTEFDATVRDWHMTGYFPNPAELQELAAGLFTVFYPEFQVIRKQEQNYVQ